MKKKWIISTVLSCMLVFNGCGNQETLNTNASAEEEMFSDRDYEVDYNEESAVLIQLEETGASSSSEAVEISGSTITITDEGTYILTGILCDGMIIVDAEETDKLQLVFNDVSINSETSAPIYLLEADKVFITLAEGTSNELTNGGTFEAIDDNNIDGVIFSKTDLTLNGSGSLGITSPTGHGIVCKDELAITSGIYEVVAKSHGISANDSVKIDNASFKIESGKDGIQVENEDDANLGFLYIESGVFDITAQGDGLSASAYILLEDGDFTIVTGGGSPEVAQQTFDIFGSGEPGENSKGRNYVENSVSTKGIKATGNLVIKNGSFIIDSADDAIHSNTSVNVQGGTFEIASGDDAFHADESLTIAAGNVNITESYEGLEGLNVEVSGGDIKLVARDDGINAAGGKDESGFSSHGFPGKDKFGENSSSNGSIVISGGELYVNAFGDGIDANGTFEISGGTTRICGPTSGDTTTLDYDTSGIIIGGTFIGTGAVQMAQTFSSSEQGVITMKVNNQQAGTKIELVDGQGMSILSCEPELSYGMVILSSPEIIRGETYMVTIGDTTEKVVAD